MQTLEVRKLGYEPVTQSVKLEAGATTQVAVTLDTIITQLARVNVIVAAMRNAFQERRRMGLGHFITQKQIEARHAAQFTDVLQTIPTLGLVYACNGRRVIPVRGMTSANGGGCVALAIDGSAVSRDVTSRAGGFDRGTADRCRCCRDLCYGDTTGPV